MARAGKKETRVRVVPLAELVADPNNVRRHSERNKGAIRGSLVRFGAARSGVVDGEGMVRAGNGALEAAMEEGIEEALVVETDGRQLVFVQRDDWTPEEAEAYAVTDNRTTDLSEFDYRRLAQRVPVVEAAGIDLEPLGWQPHELEPLRLSGWQPPAARGSLKVDTSHMTDPVRLQMDQRVALARTMERLRAARGETVTEGEALELLCEWYMQATEHPSPLVRPEGRSKFGRCVWPDCGYTTRTASARHAEGCPLYAEGAEG